MPCHALRRHAMQNRTVQHRANAHASPYDARTHVIPMLCYANAMRGPNQTRQPTRYVGVECKRKRKHSR